MHRITRRDLEIWFSVAMKMMPKDIVRGLKSKLPAESDAAGAAIAERLVRIVDGDSRMVISTEPVAGPMPGSGVGGASYPANGESTSPIRRHRIGG